MGQKATYKVGLDLDSDFDPNYGSKGMQFDRVRQNWGYDWGYL